MSIYEKVERTFGYRQLTLHMRNQTGETLGHLLRSVKRIFLFLPADDRLDSFYLHQPGHALMINVPRFVSAGKYHLSQT